MFKFKLVGGDHWDSKGKKYTKGDVISTPHDLRKLLGDKFLLLEKDSTEQTSIKVDDKPVKETSELVMKLGKDVTSDFPLAVEHRFLVFRKGNSSLYRIVDEDKPEKALNDKGSRKKEVDAFIESQLEDDDEE